MTRTHPPAEGDATDHDTMHPGVWLAFGDISGEDFWRNMARIDHVAFSADPGVADGRLTFATRNRLVAQRRRARSASKFHVLRSPVREITRSC